MAWTVDARVRGAVRRRAPGHGCRDARRPPAVTRYATCPGRLFMLFGCRRPPRASDLARAKQLAVGATSWCRTMVENPLDLWDFPFRGGQWLADLGVTEAWRLRSNLERTEGCAFQFLGGDERKSFRWPWAVSS